MEQGALREPLPPSPYDRCLERMAWLTESYGNPMQYVAETAVLRSIDEGEEAHAHMKLGAVNVMDVASTYDEPTPILYEVTVFTPEGVAVSGYIARLMQDVAALQRTVEYRFTIDKTVRRYVYERQAGGKSYEEEVRPEDIALLAEQLASLGPYPRQIDK